MGLFDFFSLRKNYSNSTDTYIPPLSAYGLEQNSEPTYQDCKNIYTSHSLGKRLVNSIVEFSLSTQRKIVIQDAPQEVVNRYNKTLKDYKIDKLVKKVACLNRVYGMSALYVSTSKKDDDYQNLKRSDVMDNQIYFKALDPYNFAIDINQNALSPLFLEASNPRVQNTKVGGKRIFVNFNGDPIYLDFTQSALNFAGRSVYQNMYRFLRTWSLLFVALERIALKASSILITKEGGNNSSDSKSLEVAMRSAELVKQMEQGQVAFLLNGEHAEFFNLNGASEIGAMISELKMGLAIALDDTPASILLDKELSNGLSEGSEDMKAVIMKVNTFRSLYIDPIYEFLDSYLFYKAWDDAFIKDFLKKGSNTASYEGLSLQEIRRIWIESFSYVWESVYPKTPDEETKEKNDVLDRLEKVKNLGADSQSIQEVLNSSKVFDMEITIKNESLLDNEDSFYEDNV